MTQQLTESLTNPSLEEVTCNIVMKSNEQAECLQNTDSAPVEVEIDTLNPTSKSDEIKSETGKFESSEQLLNKKRPRLTTVSNKEKTIEIRQGKLNFFESKINYQIHPTTIIELGQLHLAKYGSQISDSLQVEETLRKFLPLIGKLIHESDLLLPELSVYVKEILCPTIFNIKDPWQDVLSLNLVENIINEVAQRVPYSIILGNLESSEPLTSESLSVYRWEVRNVNNVFHNCLVPDIFSRIEKRVQMKGEAQILYNELSEEERTWMISNSTLKKRRKVEHCTFLLNSKDLTVDPKPAPKPALKTPILKPSSKALIKPSLEEKINTTSIRGFFSPVRKNQKSSAPVETDYQIFFHPFRVKQNMSIAKSDAFEAQILPDFQEIFSQDGQAYLNTDGKALLKEFLTRCQQQRQLRLNSSISKPATVNLDESDDDDDNSQIFESTFSGVRPKLLHFHENYRPAFYGAWQRESTIIKGRNFLAKDVDLLDYDFDSEEEWQEEEEGELLADSEEDEEDDEDFNDKEDGSESENDDWIINEDDELSQAGSDTERVPSGKSRIKNRKVLYLKPLIYGVCYDTAMAATINVTKGQPLTTLAYRTYQGNSPPHHCPYTLDPVDQSTFPIDPFSSLPIEVSQPIAAVSSSSGLPTLINRET